MSASETLLSTVNQDSDISLRRDMIRDAVIAASDNIKSGDINTIGTIDLDLLFKLYDEIFFDYFFTNNFKGKLTFSLSKRMSRSAGKLIIPRNLKYLKPDEEVYDLRMAVDFYFKFKDLEREKTVNGIIAKDSLEALQLVFEHELCHLIEAHLFRETSCKKARFKTLAANFFGHIESYHELPTAVEIVAEKYNIKPGEHIYFDYEGKTIKGFVQAINKRATIMVADKKGVYENKNGIRFSKWYVPVNALKKQKKP